MKRLFAFLSAALLVLSLAGCGGQEDTIGGDQAYAPKSAVDMLNAVWNTYADDEKFYAAGGDYSEENSVENAAGVYSLADRAAVDSALGLPETALVDEAASLIHGMNANTFTSAAYHATDDAQSLATALRDNIQQRQWMCGFPEKLMVAVVGDYVLSAYGLTEQMDTFTDHFTGIYGASTIVYSEAIL